MQGSVDVDESHDGAQRVFEVKEAAGRMVGDNEFASGERHINGIESFWSFAKRRLANFNGVPELLTNMQKLPGKGEINIAK